MSFLLTQPDALKKHNSGVVAVTISTGMVKAAAPRASEGSSPGRKVET